MHWTSKGYLLKIWIIYLVGLILGRKFLFRVDVAVNWHADAGKRGACVRAVLPSCYNSFGREKWCRFVLLYFDMTRQHSRKSSRWPTWPVWGRGRTWDPTAWKTWSPSRKWDPYLSRRPEYDVDKRINSRFSCSRTCVKGGFATRGGPFSQSFRIESCFLCYLHLMLPWIFFY